jgi:hypothetical protein
MRQHSVHSSRNQVQAQDSDGVEQSAEPAQPTRMVPVAGLAVRRRPAEPSDPPTIRRTLVDNQLQPPVNLTTEAQLQNYPWWTSLSQPQQDHMLGLLDPEGGTVDLHQTLAAVPRRAVTGGIDLANPPSFDLVEQLYNRYSDVVCADPEMNLTAADSLKDKRGLDFTAVRDVLQQVAPGARNADIFIIHPGPWITEFNTVHLDLQAVMTPGCVAYVLTDNEGSSGQAATLLQGLNQLAVFTVTVQSVVPDIQTGLVDLGPGPMKLQPYHQGNYRLIRIVA